MARRSPRKVLACRAQRQTLEAGRRRRRLAQRYPDVPLQAWATGRAGLLDGAGAKALRAWLKSVMALTGKGRNA